MKAAKSMKVARCVAGEQGAEVRLLAFPRLKFFLVTEPHATTLLDILRAHLDEDIARAARVIEALQQGRDMTLRTRRRTQERSGAHKEYKASLTSVANRVLLENKPIDRSVGNGEGRYAKD